jgi:hypothetical protein
MFHILLLLAAQVLLAGFMAAAVQGVILLVRFR